MDTLLIYSENVPATANCKVDVLQVKKVADQLSLTVCSDGKSVFELNRPNDACGRDEIDLIRSDMTISFRAPTDEELRSVPALKHASPVLRHRVHSVLREKLAGMREQFQSVRARKVEASREAA